MKISKGDALIVVDMQNDFVTGSLAVSGAGAILPEINRMIDDFWHQNCIIYYTKDSHPPDHISFRGWPVHCVKDTWGAEFAEELIPKAHMDKNAIILKGEDPEIEEYSGFGRERFHKDHRQPNLLETELTFRTATNLYICGLATDYCVKATVLDAMKYQLKLSVDNTSPHLQQIT